MKSSNKTHLQLLLLFLCIPALYFISKQFDIFENIHIWAVQHEAYDFDELVVVAGCSAVLFALFALLRWIDLNKEIFLRKQVEQELRASHETLELRVQARTSELTALNEEMVRTIQHLKRSENEKDQLEQQMLQAQKLESIGILASGVAHDFNNLLTAINGYAELVLLKTSGYSSSIREDLEKIRKAGQQASALTKQLLAFSRKQIFDLKVIRINTVIEDLTQMASRLIGENIRLEVDTDPELWNVKADKTQIEQVLMNLIINARDAMPDGGKLAIRTQNVELDREYASRHRGVTPGDYVLIAVSDTGHGMTPEVQNKIFDPFFTTKEIGKGTGLGLATVFGIVKQHRGNIWLYSEPGHGTTFKVYLPATSLECNGSFEDSHKGFKRGSEKILVVDDDPTIRDFVRDILEYHEYTVDTASSGVEALERVEAAASPYDLLLTDVIMPQMNGWTLAEKVREKWPETRVVFVSGYDDQIVPMEKVNADPMLSFLSKPLTTATLINKIHELFETA